MVDGLVLLIYWWFYFLILVEYIVGLRVRNEVYRRERKNWYIFYNYVFFMIVRFIGFGLRIVIELVFKVFVNRFDYILFFVNIYYK